MENEVCAVTDGFAFYARPDCFLWRCHTFYKIGYDLPNPAWQALIHLQKLELNRNASMCFLQPEAPQATFELSPRR
jgi:hypothetical protein